MSHPHLKDAPITEALIDIQVAGDSIEVDRLEGLHSDVLAHYPVKQARHEMSATFRVGVEDGQVIKREDSILGFLFRSTEGNQVFQARKNGFTLNRMKPYLGWETFSSEAKLCWGFYSKAIGSVQTKRIAIRYINRIDLPLDSKPIESFFKTYPHLGDGIERTLSSMFMRLVIPYENEIYVNVNIGDQASEKEGFVNFLFDIEVFKDIVLDPNDPIIWQLINRFRVIKNDVFFGSLHQSALEAYS